MIEQRAPNVTIDEDCLYLNIFAPSRKRTKEEDSSSLSCGCGYPDEAKTDGYPVVVAIHAGGFSWGGPLVLFNWTFMADVYVRQAEIVLVTIQYRLGPFGWLTFKALIFKLNFLDSISSFLGFMSNGQDDFAGNYALWDQTAALTYVKANIAAFGGDPNHVIVWGHSAGGACTSLLTYSPYSRGEPIK